MIGLDLTGMKMKMSSKKNTDNINFNWRTWSKSRSAAPNITHPGLEWFREARFGLFIHWGLYAIPAGVWKGEQVGGIGEWIMKHKQIPLNEYSELTQKFNPIKFNADEWVDMAVKAGMKYIVITAKHHDGFSIFSSPSSSYNIVDATPFKRDPLAELAEACRKAGVKLGFYYSQDQDWHDPDGAHNDWDFEEEKKDFKQYLERKVKPQIKELLSQYGPISLIWFDTPYTISAEDSIELTDLVHQIQPGCLVSGRIGNMVGDYTSLGDNQIPAGRLTGSYETPATMNDTWGYKTTDSNWKSVSTLLLLLIDLSSKGVNYLLNVGPTAEGIIPEESIARLKELGDWLSLNGEAIYGTSSSPFPYELDGIRFTQKKGHLYLHVIDKENEKIIIHGLSSQVSSISLIGSEVSVKFTQSQTQKGDIDVIEIDMPALKDIKNVPVLDLNISGMGQVDKKTVQQPDATVYLNAHLATITTIQDGEIEVLSNGITAGWFDLNEAIFWDVKIFQTGNYRVTVFVAPNRGHSGDDGDVSAHKIKLACESQSVEGILENVVRSQSPRSQHFPEYLVDLGQLTISSTGTKRFILSALDILPDTPDGILTFGARLTKV